MKKDIIKKIPNYLTISRIILIPIIIILFLLKSYKLVIFLTIIGSLTDLLDGKIARHYNVTTKLGANLDTIADKLFAIGLIICLIPKNHSISYILTLEILIGLINLYYYSKKKKTKSLMIGKIKTNFLFITIVIGFIYNFNQSFFNLYNGFKLATINLQILTLGLYIKKSYVDLNKKELTVEDYDEHQKIMNEDFDKTVVVNSINDLKGIYDVEKDDIY